MASNSFDISASWTALRRACIFPQFESPEVEAEFWQARDSRLFVFRCWMILAGIFAFWIFFVIDMLLVEEDLGLILTVRFAATAIVLGLWVLFCRDQTPAMREALIGIAGFVTIGGNTVMMTIAGPPTADLLPFAISMILAFGVGLVAPRFRTAFWVAISGYVLYWMVLPFSNTSFASILSNAHFLSISVFAALVGTFAREKLEREQAIDRRRLAILNAKAFEMGLAKDRLLATVSHELRTPVNAIAGFSEVMQQEIFGPIEPQRYRSYVDDIQFSAKLLKTGIDDLLDVSRIDMDKIAWEDVVTPLSRIVNGSVAICERDAREAGVEIAVDPGPVGVTVRADLHRLTQALVNITANAIKFSARGDIVRVVTRRSEGGSVSIDVIDEGCGIEPEDMGRVREPFGQAHSDQYSAHKGGLGLGLSIAHGLVELMEGRLDIASVPGSGTTVSITVPANRIGKAETPAPSGKAAKPDPADYAPDVQEDRSVTQSRYAGSSAAP